MKVTAKQYARALCDSLANKNANQAKEILKNLVAVLARNNDLRKINQVESEFNKIWNKEKNIVESEITSARSLDKDAMKIIKNYVGKSISAKEIIFKEKVDRNILGGVIIKYGDTVLDASIKSKLMQLINNLKK